MAAVGSARAQKLAEELLGLDIQTAAPEHRAYSGKAMDFYEEHKMAVLIGGAVVVGGLAYAGYKMYLKKKEETTA